MKRTVGLGFGLPMAMYMAVALGYDSSYSNRWYHRDVFLSVFDNDNDVTKYRVVGRELVLHTASVLNHFHLAIKTPGTSSGDVFTALVLVNGAAFVGLALLLYRYTARRDGWLVPYVVMIALVAASGYVVTPYDQLGYLLTAALCLAVFGARPLPAVLVAGIAVVGVATRESVFVAVAAAAAAAVASRTSWRDGGGRLVVGIVGATGTYALLHLALHHAPGAPRIYRPEHHAANWNQGTVVAVLITMLGALALHAAFPGKGNDWWRRARRLLWLFCSPYLVVVYLGGLWFEAPRLVMPVLLCEYLLRAVSDGRELAGLDLVVDPGVRPLETGLKAH